jgi:heat shock protein HslJ
MSADRPHPSGRRVPALAAVVLVTLTLGACGSRYGRTEVAGPVTTPELSDLEGHAWVTDVILDPHRALVAGSTLRVTFGPHSLSADAGCNTLAGGATVRDRKLVAGPLPATQKGCAAPLAAQDVWLAAFLRSRPRIERLDENLWLSRHDTVVHLTQTSG